MISSTFRFKPGNHLSHFMLSSLDSPRSDVHGNQAGLLALSKCYLNSNMDCSTCHNLHVNERGNHAAFAQHCQTCHSLGNHNFCGMAGKMDSLLLKNNCTQCHMPEQSSAIIKVKGSDTKTNMAILMVNHRIGIYQNESEKIKAALEKNEK